MTSQSTAKPISEVPGKALPKTVMAAFSVLRAAAAFAARINPLKRANQSSDLLSRAVVRSEQGKLFMLLFDLFICYCRRFIISSDLVRAMFVLLKLVSYADRLSFKRLTVFYKTPNLGYKTMLLCNKIIQL